MIYAEIAAAVLIAANLVVWGSLSARVRRIFRRVPAPPFVEQHKGRHVARHPRQDVPLTEQVIEVTRTPDKPPWAITTAANPVLTDAATLEMYQRMPVYGEACQADVRAGEQLAEAYLP